MYQIYMPMVDFYKKYLKYLKKNGFSWCMFLLSRNAETEDIFVEVGKHWTSLDDVTGKKIAFVFSCHERIKRTAMIHLGGSKGAVNPFISKVPTKENEWIWDSMETQFDESYVQHMPHQSLAELHSQSITEMVDFFEISEADVPSLVITDLITEKHYLFPVTNDINIYKVVKDITIELTNIEKQWEDLKKIDDENKEACSHYAMYLNLKDELEERIELADENTKLILSDILRERDYLKYKREPCFQNDKALRDKVKRFVNQYRHYYLPCKDNVRIASTALEMSEYAEKKDRRLRKMIGDISTRYTTADSETTALNRAGILKFVEDNLKIACIKLQENILYKNLTEDERTKYICDILSTAGRDKGIQIAGQAQQGKSESGKRAGEVDIIVKYKDYPVSIAEAMNLKCVLKKYISKHIKKIFDYDAAGTRENYLISYCNVKNFEEFWRKYKSYIESYDYKYRLVSINEKSEQDFGYSDIRCLSTTHRRNGIEVSVIHIAVKMME